MHTLILFLYFQCFRTKESDALKTLFQGWFQLWKETPYSLDITKDVKTQFNNATMPQKQKALLILQFRMVGSAWVRVLRRMITRNWVNPAIAQAQKEDQWLTTFGKLTIKNGTIFEIISIWFDRLMIAKSSLNALRGY